jgi:hypothetical protein
MTRDGDLITVDVAVEDLAWQITIDRSDREIQVASQ